MSVVVSNMSMKDNGISIIDKDMESASITMANSTSDNGTRTRGKEEDSMCLGMAIAMRVIGWMTCRAGMDPFGHWMILRGEMVFMILNMFKRVVQEI